MVGAGKVIKTIGKSGWSSLSGSDKMWAGMNAFFAYRGYKDSRQQGYGVPGSIGRGIVDALLVDVIGFKPYVAMMAATGVPRAAISGYESLTKQSREMSRMSLNKPFQNSTFVDNQHIYTMRQAGMAQARHAQHNLQHAILGQEAKFLHR